MQRRSFMVSLPAPTVDTGVPPVPCVPFLPRQGVAARLLSDLAQLFVLSAPTGCGKSMVLHSLSTKTEAHWTSLSAFEQAPETGVLLIDNVRFPKDAVQQSRLVARLAERMTKQRIVMATAAAPPSGPLVVFLASRARLLGPEDLTFTPEETVALFARPAETPEVEHWHRFVEGWPIGVALGAIDADMALALMRRGGGQRPIPRALAALFETMLAGSHAALAMDLAGFGHFPLCVLQDLPVPPSRPRPTRDHLQSLLNDGILVRDCDRRLGWLRYMPAFARFLEDRLHRLDPDRATLIRTFSAEWSALNHDVRTEMRLGLGLWAPDEAMRRLDAAGALQLSLAAGPDVNLERPLNAASARVMPQAFMSLLYERIRNGAWIEARLHFDSAYALTEGFARFETPQDQTVINAWVEVFRFVFLMADDLPPDPEWHERLAVLRQQAVGRLPVLAMALCTLSVIIPLDQGDRALALAEAEIGLQLRETVQAPRAALFVLLHKASALIASARLEDARTAIEEASALAQEDHYADSYERVSCQIHAGLLAYENGEAERAYEILALCASRVARVHGWRRMWSELFCTLARLAHATGGRASSSDWLEKGRAYALSNRQLGLKLALDLEEVGLVLRDGDLRLARLLFDALAPRLAQTPAPAPMIRHQAQILKIALLEGEGHYDDALAVLDGVDRAAVSDCDLRQHLWLEVLALGLERDRLDEDAWRWRHADVMALAARYLGLSADPVLAARLTRLTEADCAPPSSTAQLSPREQQILSLIVEGLSSKEIARRLNISEGTVKSHRKKVYEKLGVNMRSQAISRAREILGN